MTRPTTLNWNSLTKEQVEQVEDALKQWAANQRIGEPYDAIDFLEDASLLPFVEQRIRESKTIAPRSASSLDDPNQSMPTHIGPIQITDLIANRTFCDVYRGEQVDPKRQVAVKVLHLNSGGASIERAFRKEVEILAKLRHPGIAEVYLAGTSDNGGKPLLFYAMEYLNGPKLTDYAESQGFGIRERVELFQQVCVAVAHAHQNAVIHRDLKPTNILTHNGQPKILDFGISKLLQETGTVHTNLGIGTPGYISPEQFSSESAQDTRSDIFSLGITLYELLSGQLPYTRPVNNLVEAAKAISDNDFVLLSQRLEGSPRDLEAITHKCLELDPAERYQSVEMLVDDLQRFLGNDEVHARPRGKLEAAKHWGYKNPGTTASLISTAVCLMLVSLVSLIYWRNAANTAASLEELRKSDQAARIELEAELVIRRRSALNQVLANSDRNWQRNPGVVDGWLDEATQAGLSNGCFALRVMKHRTNRLRNEFQAHDSPVTKLSPSADGLRLASASDGVIKVWSLNDGRQLMKSSIEPLHVRALSLDACGERLLIQDRNGLMLLEAETGEVLHTLDTQTEGGWLTGFSRKGDLIFSAGTSSEIRVLSNDLKSVVRTLTAPFDVVAYASISSDSSRLLAISPGGDYALWNIVNGDLQFHGSAVNRSVKTFSGTQDLRTIVNAEPFTNLFVKNIESESIETIMSRGERFDHLLFSPDQNWLLSVGRSQINGRSRASGWMTQWTSVLSEPLTTLHFLPQSDAYLVGRADGRIQTFLVECEPLDQTIAEGIADPRALSLSRDGSQIVVSGKGIAVYDTVSAKRVRIVTADGLCVDSDWNSDALYVATSKQRDLLCVEDWSCGPVVGHRAAHSIRSVATGGEQVYLGLAFGEISQLVDGDSSKVETWNAHDSTVTALAYVTAKNMLLSGSDTGEVALWDQDRKLISRFQLHDGAVTEFAYVLSGERIYCSSRDGAVGVIDAKMLSALPPLRFGIGRLRTLAISPDGQSLAIASTGNDILICDAVTGEFQTRLNGHEDFVMDLCFSPSGDSLYSVSLDGTLRRWLPRSRKALFK